MTAFQNQFHFDPRMIPPIAACGYERPRPIQEQAIPLLQAGKDVIGLAQTGSGKTAAFTLPIIESVLAERNTLDAPCTKALIIAPVRELAVQIAGELQRLTPEGSDIRVLALYGGLKRKSGLVEGVPPDVIVATPGKLVDFQSKGLVDTRHIKFLILDEFDRVLENESFERDLDAMLRGGYVPPVEQRVTALFSATMSPQVQQALPHWVLNPVTVQADHEAPVIEIEHRAVRLDHEGGVAVLRRLLLERNGTAGKTLVFCNSNDRATELGHRLRALGFSCNFITGKLPQSERLTRLRALRSGEVPIVVCSDVFGRGMDIEGLDLVVNYDLPKTAEIYKHRTGRTGRAGRHGEAVTLIRKQDVDTFVEYTEALGISFQLFSPTACEMPTDPFQRAAIVNSLKRSVIAFRHEYKVVPVGGKTDGVMECIAELGSAAQIRIFTRNASSFDALTAGLESKGIAFKSLAIGGDELEIAEELQALKSGQAGVWVITDAFVASGDFAQHLNLSPGVVVMGYDLADVTANFLKRLGGSDHIRVNSLCIHIVHENEMMSLSMMRKSAGLTLERRNGNGSEDES